MEHMAHKWHADDDRVQAHLGDFVAQARDLPPPDHLALVFPDLRGAQFLQQNGKLSSLVDVETQVVGPRELDFVVAEFSLKPEDIYPFSQGYEAYLTAPPLGDVRPLYRFLYYLIEALWEGDYDEWMNSQIKFD
jgi:hypothetical protein